MVVWLADEDRVRGRFRQEVTPLKQTLMGVQRIISFALNGENRTGKFVLQIQWANVLRQRLLDIALRPQHVINGSRVAASQPVGERNGWPHRGLVYLCFSWSLNCTGSRYLTVCKCSQ